MNRVTIASAAFLVFAIAASAWLLLRAPSPAVTDGAAEPAADLRGGMTFAEWSVRSDGILLADIDPGHGASSEPRRFLVAKVQAGRMTDGPSFSWAAADRAASVGSLFALGFRVSAEGRAFVPPDDPLWSDPIPPSDAGTQQVVNLRSKAGVTTSFTRRQSAGTSNPYWGRRAIGFVSSDGQLAYVTPDAVVIPMSGH
jgi:hypothetical protein